MDMNALLNKALNLDTSKLRVSKVSVKKTTETQSKKSSSVELNDTKLMKIVEEYTIEYDCDSSEFEDINRFFD